MNRQDLNTWLVFIVPTAVGFVVWMIQRRITLNTQAALTRETTEKERLAAEHEKLTARVANLETLSQLDSKTLALLQQEMLPMAEAMKRKLVEILTHPSDEFAIPDELLAKVKKVGAHLPAALQPYLDERVRSKNPHVTEQERLAAEALPIVVRLAELEAESAPDAVITGVQLVTTTRKSVETKAQEEMDG